MQKNCILVVLLICFCIWGLQSTSPMPKPYCLTKPLYQTYPLIIDEMLFTDISDSFSGYNLQFKLQTENSFANLNKKFFTLASRDYNFTKIVAQKFEKTGNDWGKYYSILYKEGSKYSLTIGNNVDSQFLPYFNQSIEIQTSPMVQCYDVQVFYEYGIAIVDCAERTQTFSRFQNYFYVVSLPFQKVLQRVKNEKFASFTQINDRRLQKIHEPQTGQTYLLRSHLAKGVDADNSGNTYMQMFIATDPRDLQLIRVIDRSYLHFKTLNINDFQVYLGDIFLLDEYNGVLRLDIMKNQEIVLTARYIKQGFKAMDVYSDDLEDEVIIALANQHAVYQIDWHNLLDPVMINKYSLMERSIIKQLHINQYYVIVQAESTGLNGTKQSNVFYTWILSKSSRTYSNAFHVINHPNIDVTIEFSKQKNRLLVADEYGLQLFQIAQPKLSLHQFRQSMIGKSQEVAVSATSYDYFTNETMKCVIKFTVAFVTPNNMTLWPTGLNPPSNFSVNSPGQVYIQLMNYALGPLIQYSIKTPNPNQTVPKYWTNSLNATRLQFDKPPKAGDITFFHTQVLDIYGHQRIIYYYEQFTNATHIAECDHQWDSDVATCTLTKTYQHESKILYFTTSFVQDIYDWEYFYIMVLQSTPNKVRIINYVLHQIQAQISLPQSLQGTIGSIASSNGYLYVLLKNLKTINVYKLSTCKSSGCNLEFQITPASLKPKQISYFAPEQIFTDLNHPEVLFIKCLGSMLILDIDNKERVTVLDQIISAATKDRFYKMALSKQRMMLIAQPKIIEEYDLTNIYMAKYVVLVKNIPVIGYNITPNADVEFSDKNNLFFVTTVDEKKNVSVVLVYHAGYPAIATLYHKIQLDKLYSRPGFEIQVSGSGDDFLTIIAGNEFKLFRVFHHPFLVIKDCKADFEFDIQYKNEATQLNSSQVKVSVVNLPQQFTTTKQFESTIRGLGLQKHLSYSWDDKKWYTGNVVNYNYSCPECENSTDSFNLRSMIGDGQDPKVKLRQHIDSYKDLNIRLNDYMETFTGGVGISTDVIRFHMNGSISHIQPIPNQRLIETCVRVASTQQNIYTISACEAYGAGVNLYITSQVSYKAFSWGPYRSSATRAQKIQIVSDLLLLVDTQQNPQMSDRQGNVFIYKLSYDPISGNQFDELQVFNSDDFVSVHGWDKETAKLGNAHLIYSGNTKAYRLYITEITSGMFVVDFTYSFNSTQINVISINYINLKTLLQKYDLHMPIDATFQAITFIQSKYNPALDTETVLVTTKGYDNLQIMLVWDDKGVLLTYNLYRIYMRYGFYNSYNMVASVPGYTAIGYVIPPLYSRQLSFGRHYIAVYRTQDFDFDHQKGYSQRFMIGAFQLNTTSPARFSFNTTFDYSSSGYRIGLVVAQIAHNRVHHSLISKNITLQLDKDHKEQTLKIIPYNDFNSVFFNIRIHKYIDIIDEDSIQLLIYIFSALTIILILIYVFLLYKRSTSKQQRPAQSRQSLLTEQTLDIRRSIQPSSIVPAVFIKEKQDLYAERQQSELVREQDVQQQQQSQKDQVQQNIQINKANQSQQIKQQIPIQVAKKQNQEQLHQEPEQKEKKIEIKPDQPLSQNKPVQDEHKQSLPVQNEPKQNFPTQSQQKQNVQVKVQQEHKEEPKNIENKQQQKSNNIENKQKQKSPQPHQQSQNKVEEQKKPNNENQQKKPQQQGNNQNQQKKPEQEGKNAEKEQLKSETPYQTNE